MKTLIAIPSKNRIETLKKYTWSWCKDLPSHFFKVMIFVEPQDMQSYKDNFPHENIFVLRENNQGLGYSKKSIQEFARTNGYDLIFKLDDDTRGFTNFRTKVPTDHIAPLVATVLGEIEASFDQNPTLGAVAFPYSFHMFEPDRWKPAKKLQSSYVVRTEFLCPEGKFSVFEDFAVGLNILTKNSKVLKYGLIGQDVGVPVGKGTGGLQDFDRSELALAEAEMLRKIYPPITFKKVDKPWKIEPDMRSVKL